MSSRRDELAVIHIRKGQLGLDDETYRDLLERVAGVRSAKALDAAGRAKVLDELARLGAKPYRGRKRRRKVNAPEEKARLIAKIEAMLAEAERPLEYAEAILRKMTKHEHRTPLAWASPPQLHDIVAALVYDQIRRKRRAKGGA